LANTTYLHREVLDIRMGNEFSFIVPYASLQTYRDVGDSYGRIQINVLNELVCPATVSSSLQILVEASAAPDMEFAVPSLPKFAAYTPISSQMALDYQMAIVGSEENKTDNVIIDSVMSNAAMFDDGMSGARFCVGEKVMSLSQLLKVPTISTNTFSSTTPLEIQIFPYSIYQVGNSSPVVSSYTLDWYDYIACAFALSRGGMRMKVVDPSTSGSAYAHDTVAVKFYPINKTSASPGRYFTGAPFTFFDFSTNFAGQPSQYFSMDKSAVEFNVPQYHKFHSRVNSEFGAPVYLQNGDTPTTWRKFVNVQNLTTSWSPNLLVFRSVADDFQLGYFTGVPPMRNNV